MGNGHPVASWYIEIRDGEPQPMIAINVGTGSCKSESGVMEFDNVRKYSWQFYYGLLICSSWKSSF